MLGSASRSARFAEAEAVLESGLQQSAFPAAVAEVGTTREIIWQAAVGRLRPEPEAPSAALETVFDLASLTKPIVTTTLFMQLVEQGRLQTEDRVQGFLPFWLGRDRESVTIADFLAHSSGLTTHLPLYRDSTGRQEFEQTICSLPLEYQPNTQALYSDLGFILLGFIAQDVTNQPLDVQFEDVRAALDLPEMIFRPPPTWRPRTAPTGLDSWRGRVLVGEVHDRNTWALGGVAGHAGLFGTAPAVGTFARALLASLRGARGASRLVDSAVARRFCTRCPIPGSSRALGWDTMLPTSSCGTRMTPTAIGHTGYTGTSLWIDSARDLYVVLLTNRVHPTDENSAILAIRPRFHDAVIAALED